jgi:hypothetical protein
MWWGITVPIRGSYNRFFRKNNTSNITMRNLILLLLFCWVFPVSAVDIWVSPRGNDNNPGTREQPMATLLMAQRKARELRRLNDPSVETGVSIILKDGTYSLEEPLFFRPEDSGTDECPTVIKAAPGAQPVLSGGIPVTGWRKAKNIKGLPEAARGKVWEADAPRKGGRLVEFRQLRVNGKKAVRASTEDEGSLNRILSVDKENESFWIPAPDFPTDEIRQLEFVIHQWWAIAVLRVKDIRKEGDSACITFCQPESRIEFEHPWPAPYIDKENNQNGNSAFFFVNALALLNHSGEWFEDLETGKVFYWPREGEDMATADVVVPFLETLIRIGGTSDFPVSHIRFEGIRFEHSTWLRPSRKGHVPLQAGFYILDAYKLNIPGTPDKASLENQVWCGRQPAGVTVTGASNIVFERCRFSHMAATGLDFIAGAHHCTVMGCVIKDIGGTGIQGGFFGNRAFEAHLPYNPSDERQVCHHLKLSNNLITDCTNEDWGCVGISIGYAHDVSIEHNEVSHLNYSGICVGWGWTPSITCLKNNRIHANHIHHFAKNMYDVGGVYMLSPQPNTEISNNCIHHLEKAPYAHIPDHYQYIYLDERSSYIRVINNWTEKEKFFSNTPGPGNEWENNGPQVSDEIKKAAGIQPIFQDIKAL